MNLWRTLLTLSLIALFSGSSLAKIYVYEVVTETRRFQTASKKEPPAFYRYYGGSDTIYSLTVVDIIAGDDFESAAKKYKLNDNNFRDLSPKHAPLPNDFHRFIWWK